MTPDTPAALGTPETLSDAELDEIRRRADEAPEILAMMDRNGAQVQCGVEPKDAVAFDIKWGAKLTDGIAVVQHITGARSDMRKLLAHAAALSRQFAAVTADNTALREACRKANTCASLPDAVRQVIRDALNGTLVAAAGGTTPTTPEGTDK